MTRPTLYRTTARSGYRGVHFSAYCTKRPWKAYYTRHGMHVFLGYFPTAEEAALAYNKAVSRFKKTQYVLNVIRDVPVPRPNVPLKKQRVPKFANVRSEIRPLERDPEILSMPVTFVPRPA